MRDRFRTALTEMMEAELRLPHTEHFQTKRNELNNTSGYQDSRGSLCGLRWVGGATILTARADSKEPSLGGQWMSTVNSN